MIIDLIVNNTCKSLSAAGTITPTWDIYYIELKTAHSCCCSFADSNFGTRLKGIIEVQRCIENSKYSLM